MTTEKNSPVKVIEPGELDLSFTALPGSTKVYESGKVFPGLRVPFREIAQSKSVDAKNVETENAPIRVYDTSVP